MLGQDGSIILWFDFLVGNHIHIFFFSYLILIYVTKEVRYPIVSCCCFDFKRRINYIFEPNCLTVDPGVTIIELELINSLLHRINTVLHRTRRLLLSKKKRSCFTSTTNLTQIIQPHSHIQILNCEPIVENRELLKDFKVTATSSPPLNNYGFPDADGIIGRSRLLRIADNRFFLNSLNNLLQKGRVLGQKVDKFFFSQFESNFNEERELINKGFSKVVCQFIIGINDYLCCTKSSLVVIGIVIAHGHKHEELGLCWIEIHLQQYQKNILQQKGQLGAGLQIVFCCLVRVQALEFIKFLLHLDRQTRLLQYYVQQSFRNATAYKCQQVRTIQMPLIDGLPLLHLIFEGPLFQKLFLTFFSLQQLPNVEAYQIEIKKVQVIPLDLFSCVLLLKNNFSYQNFILPLQRRVEVDPSVHESEKRRQAFLNFYLILDAQHCVCQLKAVLCKASWQQIQASVNVFVDHLLIEEMAVGKEVEKLLLWTFWGLHQIQLVFFQLLNVLENLYLLFSH